MNADGELLALAAKAVGFGGEYCEVFQTWLRTDLPRGADGGCEVWNPLTDDGDAFRLMVECEISFGIAADTGKPRVAYFTNSQLQVYDIETERSEVELPVDINQATRYAIVRAAAEIGRGKIR